MTIIEDGDLGSLHWKVQKIRIRRKCSKEEIKTGSKKSLDMLQTK